MKSKIIFFPVGLLVMATLLMPAGCRSKATSLTSATRDPLEPPTKQELIDGQYLLPDIPRITVQEAYQLWNSNDLPVFIDTRDRDLYDLGHIPSARNIPLFPAATIDAATSDPVFDVWKALPKNKLIIFY